MSLKPAISEDFRHATVTAKEGLEDVISFTPVKVIQELPTPWPRNQEILRQMGNGRKVPMKDDLVLAVSHAWSHQLHPDPLGKKAEAIKKLTEEALKDYKITGEPMLFYDFMSMSQNPFEEGQPERTPQEQADFLNAIAALPEVFFTADAVLHVEGDWPELEIEKTTQEVKLSNLTQLNLQQNGAKVMPYREVEAEDGSMAKLPVFTVTDGPADSPTSNITVDDLQRLRKGGCCGWKRVFACEKKRAPPDPVFVVQPSPMGRRNAIPAAERGWIYFERLVSTIRVALTDEQYAARTVYANVPALKESILARAKQLRHNANSSNRELHEQFETYISEIREKTFSATSLDKKKASLTTTVSDVDLVFSLLTNLQHRVSLALAMTVRNLSVEECRDLIKQHADLTIQDGRGYTPLHNATRWRNVAVVELLLEHGAPQGQRDKQGNTAAHIIPLYADETTLELLQILAPDAKWLKKTNYASLRVFDRMEVWSLTGVKGGAFQPVSDWLAMMKKENPELEKVGEETKRARKHGRFRVESSTVTVKVGREGRPVQHIRPIFKPVGRILYIGLPRFIPWSLQEPIVKGWASAEGFEIWAVNEDSVKPQLLKEGPEAFMQDLKGVVTELLPFLGEDFVLVDSSFGPGAFLAWELRPMLRGALIINVHLFNAPDFETTEMAQKIGKRMAYLGETYGKCDYDVILTLLPDFMYPTGGPSGVEETKLRYKEALEHASPNFWDMAMLQPSYNFEHLTSVFTSLPEWPLSSPPVILAASDQAPLVVVGEAMQRLNQIMSGSKLESIPSSKWSWHLEGPDVIDEVTDLLTAVMPSRLEAVVKQVHVNVNGEERPVTVLRPGSSPAITRILYIGLPRFIPFSLQQPVLERWVADDFVEIWAVNEDSVKPQLLKEGPEAFMQDLKGVVMELLPFLGEDFVLVDSSFGPGAFLAWELRPMLRGALIINVHLFNAPDFETTEMAQKIGKRMAYLGETYGKRDYEVILTLLPDFMYPTGGPSGVEETKLRYKEALEHASPNFWDMAMLQPSYNFEHLTSVFTSLPEWPLSSPPVILAASDQAPLVVVGEAMQRLNQIMSGSKLESIPSSKWSWHLEGEEVVQAISDMLYTLLPSEAEMPLDVEVEHLPLLSYGTAIPVITMDDACDGRSCGGCKVCRACNAPACNAGCLQQ